jgi:hypothetical protein
MPCQKINKFTYEIVECPPLLLPEPERGFLVVGDEVEFPGHDRVDVELAIFQLLSFPLQIRGRT